MIFLQGTYTPLVHGPIARLTLDVCRKPKHNYQRGANIFMELLKGKAKDLTKLLKRRMYQKHIQVVS